MNRTFIFTVILATASNNSFSMELDPCHTKEEILTSRKVIEEKFLILEPKSENGPKVRLEILKDVIKTQKYPFFGETEYKQYLKKRALDIITASFSIKENGPFLLDYKKVLFYLQNEALFTDHNNPQLILEIINELPTLKYVVTHGDSGKPYIPDITNKLAFISAFSYILWHAAMAKVTLFTELNLNYKNTILRALIMKAGNSVGILEQILVNIRNIRVYEGFFLDTQLNSIENKNSHPALSLKKRHQRILNNINKLNNIIEERIYEISLYNKHAIVHLLEDIN